MTKVTTSNQARANEFAALLFEAADHLYTKQDAERVREMARRYLGRKGNKGIEIPDRELLDWVDANGFMIQRAAWTPHPWRVHDRYGWLIGDGETLRGAIQSGMGTLAKRVREDG